MIYEEVYCCDNCFDEVEIKAATKELAEEKLKALGWKNTKLIETLCPKCQTANFEIGNLKVWKKKKLKMKLFFAWFDLWIGLYYDLKKKIIYFCPLPMVVLSFRIEEEVICTCGKKLIKEAYLDEGWILNWNCEDGHIQETDYDSTCIEYPFGDHAASSKDFEDIGFVVI